MMQLKEDELKYIEFMHQSFLLKKKFIPEFLVLLVDSVYLILNVNKNHEMKYN